MANEYRTTADTVEVLGASPSNALVTTNNIEVLGYSTANAVVSSLTIQVLRSTATAIEIGNGITIDPGVTIGG